jgi:bisphosphoglycerate-independent phosphoglycerate mutase (AlkP superfamily)
MTTPSILHIMGLQQPGEMAGQSLISEYTNRIFKTR